MYQKIYLFFIMFFVCASVINLKAQKHANTWYFGQGLGLDFNQDSIVALRDAEMFSLARNASICDENGELLFYTDGALIWNSQHKILKNGEDLKGQHAVLIIPKPESKDLFYIFTLGNDIMPSESMTVKDSLRFTKNSTRKTHREVGLTLKKVNLYSTLVDVKQNVVIEKNKMLYQGLASDITAVKHHNKKDFWLITRPIESGSFHVFLINKNGFQEEAVLSWTGKPVYTTYAIDYLPKGILKNSVDGSKLASSLSTPHGYEIEISDFDNRTGRVSNTRTLQLPEDTHKLTPWLHGFEFSPDSKRLYATANNYQTHTFLYQFDLTDSYLQTIPVQTSTYTYNQTNYLRSMQLAVDKKIYIVTGSSTLAVIHQPDKALESCDLEFKKDLFSKNTGIELPKCTHLLVFDEPIRINEIFERKILFENGQSIIQEQYFNELKDILIFLQQNPHLKIEISGHTDDVGNSQDNQKLSEARAKAVADYLIKHNISKKRITYQGFGDTKPIADNNSKEGKAKNRRIEFLIKE